MSRHPYLRAYMAGVLLPTWFLLFVVTGFVVSFSGIPQPLERIIAFPMAVVPNLWGLWNMLYLAMGLKHRLPLGAWGALLPLILLPAGLALARSLEISFISPLEALAVSPILAGIYFLVWKHAVGFFNRVVEVDR